MAEQLLGVELDIHGGGIDLAFPHHENEAAQTLARAADRWPRIWMHNGMVQVAGDEKMSKSLGNIRGLADVLDEFGRDAVLLWLVSGHYRQPLAFGPEALEQAASPSSASAKPAGGSPARRPRRRSRRFRVQFFDALAEDFNTPRALAALYDWIRESNRAGDGRAVADSCRDARASSASRTCWKPSRAPAPMLELARRRDAARAARDWARAMTARQAAPSTAGRCAMAPRDRALQAT
jgi:cysteinyl-tRNA synthetase